MAKSTQTILVVDDESAQRELLGGFIASLDYHVSEASSAEEAIEQIQSSPPDLVVLDVRLPGMSGIEAIDEIRQGKPALPILLVTAYADLKQAVNAMKSGACDYLTKPIDLHELQAAIHDAIGGGPLKTSATLTAPPDLPDWISCASSSMQRLIETVAVVAPSEAPVLIRGESGAGKEVIAQLIHVWSRRREGPLLAANCAGLPESLMESELFGHAKGAFTGATQNRQGFFRAAAGGTLFLDEIGELPLHLQPKLLRAVESGEITPIGSDAPIKADARVIAATNRDLEHAISEGRFRADLYYRLNVVELLLPPLRDRAEDIPVLARKFASEFAGGPVRFSPQSLRCLMSHLWPGNVRELRNAIQRACLLSRGDVILPEHLPPTMGCSTDSNLQEPPDQGRLSIVERDTIRATLAETGGNRTQAAKKLGISRRALIYKLRDMESQ
jgi:DNA-binding NtrC family response regulator